MKLFVSVSVLTAIFLLSGCQEQCCQEELTTSISTRGNMTPIAQITGVPTKMSCGVSFKANGTTSIDQDGEIVAYFWTLDDAQIGTDTTKTTFLPCDDANHTLCLSVQDDKGAKATTCQNISVITKDSANINIPIEKKCDITPIITYEKADAQQYKFFCAQSMYKGKPIDPTKTECLWQATKTFTNSQEQDSHDVIGPLKWVNVNPDTFKALDLTLSVKNSDCEQTLTKHYILPQDLPY